MKNMKNMEKLKNDKNQDFYDFMRGDFSVPPHLKIKVLDKISSLNDMHKKQTLAKMFFIQLFIGCLSLLFCPLAPFSFLHDLDILHALHNHIGPKVCTMACSILFLTLGTFFTLYVFSWRDIKLIKTSKIMQLFSLFFLLNCVLLFYGVESYLEGILFWSLGAFLGQCGGLFIHYSFRNFSNSKY